MLRFIELFLFYISESNSQHRLPVKRVKRTAPPRENQSTATIGEVKLPPTPMVVRTPIYRPIARRVTAEFAFVPPNNNNNNVAPINQRQPIYRPAAERPRGLLQNHPHVAQAPEFESSSHSSAQV